MGQHSHNNIMNNNNNLTNNTDTSTKQSKHVKTSNSKNNGYRAKELAEIKNGLQPFEKAEALRTVSSLSTESSTNSVSSDGLTGGSGVVTDPAFSSVQDTLLKLNSLGYDEASAMRAVTMGETVNTVNSGDDGVNRQLNMNNLTISNTQHPGLTATVVRRPSLEQRPDLVTSYNLARMSPVGEHHQAAPALPPRSAPGHETVPGLKPFTPTVDPPLLPPRTTHTPGHPPPTPPRGTTPPPPLPPHNAVVMTNGSVHLASNHPVLMKRMSPVPGRPLTSVPAVSSALVTRGQSPQPRNTQPLVVSNSVEAQQQVAQQMQALSIFPSDNNQSEPPPPYPMGTAAMSSPAPPSYSQTLALRQSPTLSSTSSDYRRSPLPLNIYPNVIMAGGQCHIVNGVTPASPVPAAPSPVNSILSGSSRSSMSSAAWSARQAKTQSPVIMQSVRSTQVQKPVLQQALGVSQQTETAPPALIPRTGGHMYAAAPATVVTGQATAPPPPPSYSESIQKKLGHAGPATPAQVNTGAALPAYSVPRPVSQQSELPPPPPYPSSAVSSRIQDTEHRDLVQSVSVSRQSPVINTAKVTVTNNANLVRLQDTQSRAGLGRKYSPHLSETSSRSDSPNSESLSAESPVQFSNNNTVDSGVVFSGDQATDHSNMPPPPPYKTVINTSPRPERKTYSREQDEIRNESKIKKYPPSAYKFYMEQHVENVIKYYEDRRKRRMQLEQEMMACVFEEGQMETMRKMLTQKESNFLRMKRAKIDKSQFKKIKAIGLGAFGEVCLVRKKDDTRNSPLYAMKTLKKSEVLMRNQVAHVKAERDILAEADNDWIVKLYHSFQDQNNLYFVMEYIPGGDLMSLLIKKGIFEEPLAKFYISELVCAVDSVHKMGFIHRDIKPDNILIDGNGHIKLTDFGLCTGFRWTHNSKYYQHNVNGHSRQDSMDPGNLDLDSGRCSCPAYTNGQKLLERRKKREHARCIAHSLVGTPNYIAPEVLERRGYNQSCDWWSVGVILYEMLVGQPPFLANNPAETQMRVIKWYDHLRIPRDARLSEESKSLILSLCTSEQQRLGKNGCDEIRNHDFFRGIDFSRNIRDNPAPHKPEIKHELDTSNFDAIDPDKLRPEDEMTPDEDNNRDYHGFYEFTFRRFFDDAGHPAGFRPGPNAMRAMRDDNENPSGPVYV